MIELRTKTTEVTVFINGARVTRAGQIELGEGRHDVKVTGLSPWTDESSIRVRGLADAMLIGIATGTETAPIEDRERIAELEERLRELELEKANIEDIISADRAEQEYLTNLARGAALDVARTAALSKDVKAKDVLNLSRGIRERIMRIKEAGRENAFRLEDIKRQIEALRQTIDEMKAGHERVKRTVVILTVQVPKKTTLDIGLSYQVDDAGWSPRYDVDLGREKSTIRRIAMVRNRTEEDWTDVQMVVSTASAQPAEAIEPTPFYIRRFVPRPRPMPRARVKKKRERPEPAMAYAAAAPPAPPEMPNIEEEFAEVETGTGGVMSYKIPGAITILSGESPQPVTLIEEELESERLYFWNAAEEDVAVVAERLTNGDATLLEGPAKIYAGGEYIGESRIGLVAPREEFRLGARTAHDVRVEKKLLSKKAEKAGVRGKNRIEYEYELIVKNFSGERIKIEIVDTIPHSSSEKIRVELEDVSVPYKSMELGVLTWEIEMEKGQETNVRYRFEVEWERDVMVTPPLP